MTPAGVKLDHHGVLERLTDHHVHVQQRELPYSSVKLEEKEAFIEFEEDFSQIASTDMG